MYKSIENKVIWIINNLDQNMEELIIMGEINLWLFIQINLNLLLFLFTTKLINSRQILPSFCKPKIDSEIITSIVNFKEQTSVMLCTMDLFFDVVLLICENKERKGWNKG